jgi:hypothetical protein
MPDMRRCANALAWPGPAPAVARRSGYVRGAAANPVCLRACPADAPACCPPPRAADGRHACRTCPPPRLAAAGDAGVGARAQRAVGRPALLFPHALHRHSGPFPPGGARRGRLEEPVQVGEGRRAGGWRVDAGVGWGGGYWPAAALPRSPSLQPPLCPGRVGCCGSPARSSLRWRQRVRTSFIPYSFFPPPPTPTHTHTHPPPWCSENQRVRARVLYVDAATKRVGLTLLPHLLERLPPANLPMLGQVRNTNPKP